MIVADASVMVSILRLTDIFHDQSIQWFSTYLKQGGTLIAPDLLLSEVAGVISRDADDPNLGIEAITWLRALPELTIVTGDESLAFMQPKSPLDSDYAEPMHGMLRSPCNEIVCLLAGIANNVNEVSPESKPYDQTK